MICLRHNNASRARAFTLAELLVVIAILAILASLLFPVLAKAGSRAYLVQDISNMRQLYIAIDLYSQDDSNALPGSLLYVEPYVKSRRVFVSHFDPYRNGIPHVPDFPANMDDGPNLRSPFRISYAYLVPTAYEWGMSDAWLQEQRNNPSYGLLALSMDNKRDPSIPPLRCQADHVRWQFKQHRIRMDGSYHEAHAHVGVSWTCSLDGCFGRSPGRGNPRWKKTMCLEYPER